jgi:hypothetical protein
MLREPTSSEPRPHHETEYLAIFDEGPLAIQFRRRLKDFFTSLASGRSWPSRIHTDYYPEADERFRIVLLKALLAPYDPRVRSVDRAKMRKFLARNITMLWFPGLPRTRGRKRTVSEAEQRSIRPLYTNVLKLCRERRVSADSVRNLLRQFLPRREFSSQQWTKVNDRIDATAQPGNAPFVQAREILSAVLDCSRSTVDVLVRRVGIRSGPRNRAIE